MVESVPVVLAVEELESALELVVLGVVLVVESVVALVSVEESASALESALALEVLESVPVEESELALELVWGVALEPVPLAPTARLPPTVSLDNQTTDLLLDCEAHRTLSQWHL